MIRKLAQFEQAIQLRKRGFTYDDIAKMTGVAKSTVSSWISRETWSQSVRDTNKKRAAKENSKRISLLNKSRGTQHAKLYAEAERSAVTEYKHYKHNPLFVAGIMLCVASGDSTSERLIRITSTNMDVHRMFVSFAKEYLGVSRESLRFWLLLSPDQSPEACSRRWSKKIGVPIAQFHKCQVGKKRKGGKSLHFGVGNTIIGSTVLKHKLRKWIELSLKEL